MEGKGVQGEGESRMVLMPKEGIEPPLGALGRVVAWIVLLGKVVAWIVLVTPRGSQPRGTD